MTSWGMMDQLDRAVRAWPQITGVPVLHMQRENVVYRVDTAEGPHALRLHRRGYHGEAALQSELDLMAMLAAQGMQVPRPMASAGGGFLVPVGDRHASLLSWLPGQPMGRSGEPLRFTGAARAGLFHTIGAEMARLHGLADAWVPPSGFARHAWDSAGLVGHAPFWGRFWEFGGADADLLIAVRDWARQGLGGSQDYGLIHADLVNENVLVDAGRVHFIDFDDCGYGFRAFDLATTLYKAVDEPDFADLQAALLAGYATRRAVPGRIGMFIVLRSLTYLGWIAAREGEPGMEGKAARYLDIAKRVIARFGPEGLDED